MNVIERQFEFDIYVCSYQQFCVSPKIIYIEGNGTLSFPVAIIIRYFSISLCDYL